MKRTGYIVIAFVSILALSVGNAGARGLGESDKGILTMMNLIVATQNNAAPICLSVKKAAQGLIRGSNVSEGLLNRVEMALRAYDPCLSCATHSLPGKSPLTVNIRDTQGNIIRTLNRP
jgi:F420-non-reducing hydrogenase large subunit